MTSGPSLLRIDLEDAVVTFRDKLTVHLVTGSDLTLVWAEDMIPIFRADPAGSGPEMWTNHMDRPGLYIRVGDWPETFDPDAAIDAALKAQDQAEIDFDLNNWAPRDVRRALAPSEGV